ncbi:hypothetical protein CPB84DRAFT_1783210 [Gymnopilus junonius]|uniref:Uncharacterized protein n=1 Tax=Gymnopilus junonius TaxID=109634 RepID=A0A9P5NHY7_GYMJU|nr:hypothetical protein CPB84DRAFT_1783210 [Gymnopilus junonius]
MHNVREKNEAEIITEPRSIRGSALNPLKKRGAHPQHRLPLVAHTPLGPPAALLPLLLSSRALHATLTAPAFLARICRFKLDTAAVTRRLFTPHHPDLAEHLVHTCLLLQAIKTGDVDHVDVEDYMASALLLMLDNDGKNYAQLKHAGVHAYVDKFVENALVDGREENNGWPVHNEVNATALWLMWLLTERDSLLAGRHTNANSSSSNSSLRRLRTPIPVLRALRTTLTCPQPHRESHHQPPSPSPSQQLLAELPTLPPPASKSQVYFRSRPALSWPLASIPAKLLFVARRELRPIAIPQHIPPGPAGLGGVLTQADYRELNAAKAADLPRGAIWDWERGVGVGVNDPYVPPPAPASLPLAPAPASLTTPPTTTATAAPKDPIPPGDEESRKWDTTFWRMRLCGDFQEPRPKFLPGETFKLGSMSGAWQGRIYIPQGAQYTQLLHQPLYPGVPDERAAEAGYGLLSENSLGLVMQPIFLDVREHHRVCFCAEEEDEEEESEEDESEEEDEEDDNDNDNEEGSDEEDDAPTPTPNSTHPYTPKQKSCGIIPTPQPKSWVEYDRGLGVPGPGAGAPPPAGPQAAPVQAPPAPQPPQPPQPNPPNPPNLALSNLAQLNPETHPSAFSFSPTKSQFPDKIDMGMCNAWFPGGQGGVGWVERGERSLGYDYGVGAGAGASASGSAGITRPNTNTTANTTTNTTTTTSLKANAVKLQPRDEIVFGVDFTAPLPQGYAGAGVNVRGGCVSAAYGPVAASASSHSGSRAAGASGPGGAGTSGAGGGATNTGTSPVEERRNGFVYETWNPRKLSSHDLLHLFSDPGVELEPSLPMSSSSSSSSAPSSAPAPVSASNPTSSSTSTSSSSSSNTPAPPSSNPNPNPNQNQNQNLNSLTSHLKHTFKPGASCAHCDTRSRALREQRRREEAQARRVLDGVMRRFGAGVGVGVGVGVGLSKSELESESESEAKAKAKSEAAAMSAEMSMSKEERMNVDEPEREGGGVDVDVDMQDLDMDGFGDEVGRVVGDALISSMFASATFDAEEDDNDEEDDDEEEDEEEEEEEEDEEEEEEDYYEVEELEEDLEDLEEMEASDDDNDDAHTHTHKPKSKHTSTSTRTRSAYAYGVDKYGRMEVLGDDLPNGEPGFYRIQKIKKASSSLSTSASVSTDVHNADAGAHDVGTHQAQAQAQTEKRTHIPATRREYDRSRIGVPCTGVKDVVITGETGRRHRGWQDYRCYGRVRMWDGLVGILRFSRRSETNAIFIFGYVVGDNNFVGEWRVAASDPLRPVWGSAFVMSKRRDGVPSEAD